MRRNLTGRFLRNGRKILTGLALAALAAGGLAPSSWAQTASITIDLNKLEPQEDACRAYLVLENGTDREFSVFTLDLYIFGADGIITKRLAVDSAPLTPGKTRVRLLDIRDTPCESISQVLINDVIDCVDNDGTRQDCVTLLEPSSHAAAKLVK